MGMYCSKVNVGGKEKVLVAISHKEEMESSVVETTIVDKLHHIHILDRSGSMYSSINQLIDNVQKTIEAIGEEDVLTIIWFSGAGQHRTVIKGAGKFEKLNTILDGLRSTVGCTCFSDPLKEVNLVLDELGDIAPVSVTLFTDGCPVVPWSTQEEEKRCFAELAKMKDKILAFNTVGYGNYYNQELLKGFSATSEFGSMIHSTKIEDYLSIFNHNFEKVSGAVCEKVYIASEKEIIYLNRTFTKMTERTFDLSRLDKRKNQFFLIADRDFPFIYQDTPCSTLDTKFISKVPEASVTNFLYAYAYNLYYAGKRLESLDILSKNLKDKALIDSHLSSFTFDECAEHIKKLEKAVTHNEARGLDGYCDENYLPADDALCVLDILNKLQSTDSYYIPFSKNIKGYDRIGRKAEDTFNLFEKKEEEVRTPFSDFVYNKEHMNLSIRFYINGSVKLNPKEAKALEMPLVVDSGMFRNHTIIKDGNLNMKQIEAIIPSEEVDADYMLIVEQLALGETDAFTHSRVVIDLASFPIVNRTYIKESGNIDAVFAAVKQNTEFEALQKVIGYWIDKSASSDVLKKTGALADYSVDQIRLLESHGLDKNLNYKGVDIKKASAEESDSYQSRTMEFYFAGFSSWGKVADMIEKVNAAKKLTPNLQELCDQFAVFGKLATSVGIDLNKECVATRDFLVENQKWVKNHLLTSRNHLSVLKIAKLLSGDWFPELQVDEKGNYFYEKDGYKMIAKAAYTTEYF
jgi:hypothetical protein